MLFRSALGKHCLKEFQAANKIHQTSGLEPAASLLAPPLDSPAPSPTVARIDFLQPGEAETTGQESELQATPARGRDGRAEAGVATVQARSLSHPLDGQTGLTAWEK